MSNARIFKTRTRQTNKDRHRHYRLSPRGLISLRATALQNKPWLRSTGPRTPAGKDRSKVNAMKHGERSAQRRAAWRELNAALRAMSQYDRKQASAVDGIASAISDAPDETWVRRIANELRLSNLSQELLLARFTEPTAMSQEMKLDA